MSQKAKSRWKTHSPETRMVEEMLRKEFHQADAYRYNPASIRVRVVDPRFNGKSDVQRDKMVERVLAKLPDEIQADIMNLLTLYPGETEKSLTARVLNEEFEDPSPSEL